MLTVSDSPNDLLQAIKTGADGYLLQKIWSLKEILENINRAIEGQVVLSPVLTNALAEALKEKKRRIVTFSSRSHRKGTDGS